MATSVSAALTAADTYTAWLDPAAIRSTHHGANRDLLSVSVTGTFVGTLDIQIRFKDDLATIIDTGDQITAEQFSYGLVPHAAEVRIGFKAGNFTSGTANVRLGADNFEENY